jgi:hypothetical protein
MRSLFDSYRKSLVLLIFISACSPPVQVATVSGRLEPLPDSPEMDHSEADSVRADAAEPLYPVVEVGRFDDGKMWTFDHLPTEYLKETYSIAADSSWFNKARLGALRFSTYCSASLVSPRGLVMTNHHCARESIIEVQKKGETLLDDGFYANADSLERKVPELFVEQLVGIEDVTPEVHKAAEKVIGAAPQAEARRKRAEAIENRTNARLKLEGKGQRAEVVEFYAGGKYSLYTYNKFDDVRLVFAPELKIGYFGGDTDNFTYPRHTLDMSFFRIWQHDSVAATPTYFEWNVDGINDGDAVFVVGNPGSTSRLSTVSQLEYERDIELPGVLEILDDRTNLLADYVAGIPAEADSFNVRNSLMEARNMQKALEGQHAGLLYGDILSRTYSSELVLRDSIASRQTWNELYGSVHDDISLLQISKKASAKKAAAFYHFLNPSVSSHILSRAIYGYVFTLLKQRGAPKEQLDEIRKEALAITSWPKELEKQVIAHRLADFSTYLGPADPTMKRLLGNGTIEEMVDSLVAKTVLADSSEFRKLLDDNYLASDDPTVNVINALAPLYFTLDQELRAFGDRENALQARLAIAQLAIFGEESPPDATFTLRLADGRVASFPRGRNTIDAFMTFESFYSLAYQRGDDPSSEWSIPQKWKDAESTFPKSTPINLVSTNDITEGNSGSPLLDSDLKIVGLVFDGNLESLPNEYVYDTTDARAVSVDARGMVAALRYVYGADRILTEILPGQKN